VSFGQLRLSIEDAPARLAAEPRVRHELGHAVALRLEPRPHRSLQQTRIVSSHTAARSLLLLVTHSRFASLCSGPFTIAAISSAHFVRSSCGCRFSWVGPTRCRPSSCSSLNNSATRYTCSHLRYPLHRSWSRWLVSAHSCTIESFSSQGRTVHELAVALSCAQVQLYDATLMIDAELEGIRYYMFYYPLMSLVVGTTTILGFAWFFLLLLLLVIKVVVTRRHENQHAPQNSHNINVVRTRRQQPPTSYRPVPPPSPEPPVIEPPSPPKRPSPLAREPSSHNADAQSSSAATATATDAASSSSTAAQQRQKPGNQTRQRNRGSSSAKKRQ